MMRELIEFSIEDVFEIRDLFVPTEYQRNPNIWNLEKKQLLIDSILTGIDIPKIYLNKIKSGDYEIIDGLQRMYAIWDFIENEYPFKSKEGVVKELEGLTFDKFPIKYKNKILSYKIQFTVFNNANDDLLRKLFIRLQLGLLLVPGEKLKAEKGMMRDFIFSEMVKHKFISNEIKIQNRRFAKQTLCSQICINSFKRASTGTFTRTRYEDLMYFYREYKKPDGEQKKFFEKQIKHVLGILDILNKYFGEKDDLLKNRSFIISIFLFVEEMHATLGKSEFNKQMEMFVKFIQKVIHRLSEEIKLGINRKNEHLYKFESYTSSAPGEAYRIKARHELIEKLFKNYKKTKKILGDK